jgi:large subunit ribosomal protein L15
MKLHQLEKPPGSTRPRKRKGRGPGSTLGKTAGRGQKGQRARGGVKAGFEGGQTPLRRRLPRRGFKNLFKARFHIVNLSDLTRRPALAGMTEVRPEDLAAARAISDTQRPVKVLGVGDLNRAVTVHAHKFSHSAAEKIQAAGGRAVVIEA